MANQNKKQKHSSRHNHKDNDQNRYLKFTGLAFELLAFNLICIWGGIKLDQKFGFSIPWILIGALIISVAGSIYYIQRRLNQD